MSRRRNLPVLRTTEHDLRLAAGSVLTQPLAPCFVAGETGRHFRRRFGRELASDAGKVPRALIVGRLIYVLDKEIAQCPHTHPLFTQ
jgi:hypothetical protein